MLEGLNNEQQEAIVKSILAKPYHLVLGIPGSGKTHAIAVLLKILASMKQRVLVVSYTNSALDTILLRLLKSGFE